MASKVFVIVTLNSEFKLEVYATRFLFKFEALYSEKILSSELNIFLETVILKLYKNAWQLVSKFKNKLTPHGLLVNAQKAPPVDRTFFTKSPATDKRSKAGMDHTKTT